MPTTRRLPTISPPIRMTLAVAALVLGMASVVAHACEYAGVERFSKDFALDYSSAKALVDGEDPYAPIRVLIARYLDPPPEVLRSNVLPGANWHTPFKLVFTLPFTALPFQAAGVLWLLVSAATIVASGVILGSELGWSRNASLVVGVATLAVPVVQIDLSAGQLNGPMLLLLVLTWRSIRRGSDAAGGIALGVLVALKFFPVFLALPLLATRRFRAVVIAATSAAVLTLAGAAVLGADHTESFLAAGRGSEGFDYWDASPANIAWWGLATRWLTPNGWVHGGVDATPLALALAVAGVVAACAAALLPRARISRDSLVAAIPLMLLAWPIVWVHYLTLAIPWVVLSARQVARDGRPGLLLGFFVVAFLLLLGFPPVGNEIESASSLEVALRYQLPTLALLGAVALDRLLRRRDAATDDVDRGA